MKHKLQQLAVLICILTIFAAPVTPLVTAQTTDSSGIQRSRLTVDPLNDFVLEPGKAEIFLDPGETTTRTVTVTSRIPGTARFEVLTEDFKGSDDPSNPVVLLGGEEGPYSLKNFISPATTSFSVQFGEKVTIPVTVTVPADTSPGGYYGAVIVASVPEEDTSQETVTTRGTTRIISRIGVLFLVRVNGDVLEQGALEDFRILGPKKLFHQKAPEGFEILFRNTGTVHLVPHGVISIYNIFGSKIASMPVDAYFALPSSLRYREVRFTESPFMLGRYKAVLEFFPGYGDSTVQLKTAYWVLPLKIVLPIFFGLLLVIFLVYFIVTRFEFKRKVTLE